MCGVCVMTVNVRVVVVHVCTKVGKKKEKLVYAKKGVLFPCCCMINLQQKRLSLSVFFTALMCLHMLRKVIRSWKCLLTTRVIACKRSLKGMDTHMSFQMLESLERSLAFYNRAYMWSTMLISATLALLACASFPGGGWDHSCRRRGRWHSERWRWGDFG